MSVAGQAIHLWKQISETLAGDIRRGALPPGGRLPASDDLAARFGVNRHTVLRAVSHLQSAGMLRVERGRGTFVVEHPLEYSLDAHQRFEQNLLKSNTVPTRRLIVATEMPCPPGIAKSLDIAPDDTVAMVTIVGEGDGHPVNLNTSYFPVARMPGITEAFRRFGFGSTGELTFDGILQPFGYAQFRRKSVRIRSREAVGEEAQLLQMAPSQSVLETEVTSVSGEGIPVMHAFTRFCAARVEFVLEL
jgi:GntR family phosphonate transport system transcriptional regulator